MAPVHQPPTRRPPGATIVGASGEALRVGARLGWLYLDQGHLADAAAVFEAVLASDPDDISAREGLDTVSRRREAAAASGASTAADTPADGIRRRRIAALTAYLDRIRRAAAAAAP